MRKTQYLQQLGHSWYLRVKVPTTLQGRVGSTHIRRALGTRDLDEAVRRKWPALAQVRSYLDQLRSAAPHLPASLPATFCPPATNQAPATLALSLLHESLLHQWRFGAIQNNALNVGHADQVLQVLRHRHLPDALIQLGTDGTLHQLERQQLTFDALIDPHHMETIAAFQRLAGQAQRQAEQLTLELGHRLPLADLTQCTTLLFRGAGRMGERQFSKARAIDPQLSQQGFGLLAQLAALLGVIRRTGQQDMPGGQQRRAGIACTVAFEILPADCFRQPGTIFSTICPPPARRPWPSC